MEGLPKSVIRKASRFNNRRVYSPGKAKLVSKNRLISILKTGLRELVGKKLRFSKQWFSLEMLVVKVMTSKCYDQKKEKQSEYFLNISHVYG